MNEEYYFWEVCAFPLVFEGCFEVACKSCLFTRMSCRCHLSKMLHNNRDTDVGTGKFIDRGKGNHDKQKRCGFTADFSHHNGVSCCAHLGSTIRRHRESRVLAIVLHHVSLNGAAV